MSTDVGMHLGAMGRSRTAAQTASERLVIPSGTKGSTSTPQRLFIQVHRHSVSRSLPHRRTPRARRRQVRQVVPAFGLISPRLDLLVTDGDSVKKTLAHTNSVDDSHERYRCMSRHGQRRENNAHRTRKGPRTSFRCAAPFCLSRNPSAGILQTADTQVSRRPRASNS